MGVTDFLTWGAPFWSVWRNLQLNLLEGVSKEYGVHPPYWYFAVALHLWRAAIVPMVVFFTIGARRAPLLATLSLVVVLSHSAIAHKEISFIYAALPPAIITIGLGTAEAAKWFHARLFAPPKYLILAIYSTIGWIAVCAATALGGGFRLNWLSNAGYLKAAAEIRQHPELCGLGLYGSGQFHWHKTGGNAYLDRLVPIYLLETPAALDDAANAFNFVLAEKRSAGDLTGRGFTLLQCWDHDKICLARAERASCVPTLQYNINRNLRLGRASPSTYSD
jgi:hypothetical protein